MVNRTDRAGGVVLYAGALLSFLRRSYKRHVFIVGADLMLGPWKDTPVYIETPDGYQRAAVAFEETLGIVISPVEINGDDVGDA